MRNLLKYVVYPVLVYVLLNTVIQVLRTGGASRSANCTDQMQVINAAGDRDHEHVWQLVNQSRYYCTKYQTTEEANLQAADIRSTLGDRLGYEYDYLWGRVYEVLVQDSGDEINYLADSLRTIAQRKEMNTLELAELVVSFVQDIPYSYVIGGDCETYETDGKPCLGNIPFGIISPYEFLHTQYGDCDTRAVLIYVLLEYLGYTPAIVVSDEYRHAMLALNLPATGDFLEHRGERYYFWETTSTGWPLGILPPNSNNVKYWKIALAHEL